MFRILFAAIALAVAVPAFAQATSCPASNLMYWPSEAGKVWRVGSGERLSRFGRRKIVTNSTKVYPA